MRFLSVATGAFVFGLASAQQIQDVWHAPPSQPTQANLAATTSTSAVPGPTPAGFPFKTILFPQQGQPGVAIPGAPPFVAPIVPLSGAALQAQVHARRDAAPPLFEDMPGLQYQKPPAPAPRFSAPNKKNPKKFDMVIRVDDKDVRQQIRGLGGSLTDSSAKTLLALKEKNPPTYQKLMNILFDPQDANRQNAALNFIRVPIGSSDFSPNLVSNEDKEGDFKLAAASSGILEVLHDIIKLNPHIVVQALPWSPPAWMKINKNDKIRLSKDPNAKMMGGKLDEKHLDAYAKYLSRTVQEFHANNVTITFLGLQNEPLNEDFSYPSCKMSPRQMAELGGKVRQQLNAANLHDVKLTGFEHNWKTLTAFSDELRAQTEVFDSYGAHCYKGDVAGQLQLHESQRDREILVTECTGTIGSDFGQDLAWQTEHITVGAFNNLATTGAMWNIALDAQGEPKLPGTGSCKKGCRPIVTINSEGKYHLNQEFYVLGMVSKAVAPKDPNGPMGKRIHARVTGRRAGEKLITVGAYVTGRTNPTEDNRYAVVALNKQNKPLDIGIEFREQVVPYTLEPGLTTLSFYAPPKGGSVAKKHAIRRRFANH